jgi:hypothetical protein
MHLTFVDYKIAFHHVMKPHLWKMLSQKGFPTHLIQAIKSLYTGTKVRIDQRHQIGQNVFD